MPDCLEVMARTREARSWACATEPPGRGRQYHSESILTEYGNQLVKNWLGAL
jgi:anthranilate/para-aminobenzoate synthase component II